jgi:hypothetical protein
MKFRSENLGTLDIGMRTTLNGGFEVFTAVTMKNAVFWDVTPYLVFLRSVRRLLVTASVVLSSPILVALTKEALSSPETSVLTELHVVTS